MIFSFWLGGLTSATALEICGELKQGELLIVKDNNTKKINFFNNLNNKSYVLDKDGATLVALHRDAPKKIEFAVYPGTDDGDLYEIDITPVKWDIQRIDGVAQSKVTPASKADLREIRREQRDLERAITHNVVGEAWREGFILPVKGRISGNFGNQRIFNGVPKNPHTGVDIAAPDGTSVEASGRGMVVLSGKDYFYTGNMVIIDHGMGLQTIYAHLKDVTVQQGDTVAKGQVIGHVGQTGRATGPHLHWGASLNNVRFNPYSLLNINEKKCRRFSGRYMGE
jgi:murein DD-endopeptidase MepM/ murein hydrolase activator NlpD